MSTYTAMILIPITLEDTPGSEALLVEALKAIDPFALPGFAGTVRVAVSPYAEHVLEWLDGQDVPPVDVDLTTRRES